MSFQILFTVCVFTEISYCWSNGGDVFSYFLAVASEPFMNNLLNEQHIHAVI